MQGQPPGPPYHPSGSPPPLSLHPQGRILGEPWERMAGEPYPTAHPLQPFYFQLVVHSPWSKTRRSFTLSPLLAPATVLLCLRGRSCCQLRSSHSTNPPEEDRVWRRDTAPRELTAQGHPLVLCHSPS